MYHYLGSFIIHLVVDSSFFIPMYLLHSIIHKYPPPSLTLGVFNKPWIFGRDTDVSATVRYCDKMKTTTIKRSE